MRVAVRKHKKMGTKKQDAEEQESERQAAREKRIEVQKIILLSIGAAGLIGAALIAPNILGAIHRIRKMTRQNDHRYRNYIDTAIGRLKRKGLLESVRDGGKVYFRLTDEGERELLKYRLKEKLFKKRRWDKKWRIVTFDIREQRRVIRNRWRKQIAEFGFIQLQQSVWVSPYECEELIQLLKAEFRVGKEVLYVVADRIENDRKLREHFELK